MHDAIPSRILNGWLRLEEDLFHLQVLSYLPPQFPSYPPQYTMLFPYKKASAYKRLLRQLSAPRLIQSNNYVPGGISCAADLTAIFRHKISVSGAPSGKRLLSASAHSPGGSRRFQCPARRGCRRPGKTDPPQSAAGGTYRKKYYALPGDQEDLVSIGTIGLMKAVDTFDATRKARFSTYASRCIENAILSPAHFGMDLIFALTYMAFRKTRSRSSNIAFHAGCPENTACST